MSEVVWGPYVYFLTGIETLTFTAVGWLFGSATSVAPQPTFPPDGTTKIAVTPTLVWTDPGSLCNSVTSFDLEIATDAAFSQHVQNFNGLSGYAHILTSPLKNATQYFWRVIGHRGGRSSVWSQTFHFTTVQVGTQPGGGGTPPEGPDIRKQRCFLENCYPRGLAPLLLDKRHHPSSHHLHTSRRLPVEALPALASLTERVALRKADPRIRWREQQPQSHRLRALLMALTRALRGPSH